MTALEMPKKLKNSKRFTYKEALLSGLTRRKLARLVTNAKVYKITRGIYGVSQSVDENPSLAVACKVVGFPCAICLWSALVYYDLTDEIDLKTWVMVSSERRKTHKNIRLVRLKDPHWKIGIIKEKDYWVTSLERTIIDSLTYPRYVGTMAATTALKRALQSKLINISNLVEMASQLGSLKKIYPRLEAFIE